MSANTNAKEAAMQMLDGRAAAALARVLPAAALVAALALGAWLGAGWFVYFSTPPAVPAVPAREKVTIAAAAQAAAEAHVFGAAPLAGGIAVSTLNVKLKGVFASGAGAPGYAIVNTGGRDQSASVGAEISPGVALDSVHARHIVLKRNGIFERVNLVARPLVAQAAPRPVAPPPAAAPAPPPRTDVRTAAAPADRRTVPAAGTVCRSGVPTEPPPPTGTVRRRRRNRRHAGLVAVGPRRQPVRAHRLSPAT
jgi:hypothetical protein